MAFRERQPLARLQSPVSSILTLRARNSIYALE